MAKTSRRALAKIVAAKLLRSGSDSRQVMQELAAFLVVNKMTDDADVIMNNIAVELLDQAGLLTVEVTSAHGLTDEARDRLKEFLAKKTGAQSVQLHEIVDVALIGGLTAMTPSADLDASVRGTLRQLTAIAG